MTTYTTQRVRVLQNVTKWFDAGLDVLTASSPRFGNGVAVQFEFAFAFGELDADANLVNFTDYSSLTLDVKRSASRTGLPVMTKTVAIGSINTTLTKAQWESGAYQHVAFTFTQAETDIFLTQDQETLWLVVSGLTTTGRLVTMAAWNIIAVEDGAGVTAPAAVIEPTYYTAAQSDARFLLTADLTAKLNKDGSNSMTGDLTLANSTPSNALHAASKGYVDAQTTGMFLPLAGGTLTGMLVLTATAPTLGTHATNKTYVDGVGTAAQAASVPNTGVSSIAGAKTFSSLLTASAGISVAGGVTLTSSDLTLFQAPTSGMHAVTKTYADGVGTAAQAASVPNTGNTTIAGIKTFSDAITASVGITVTTGGLTISAGTLTVVGLTGVLKASAGAVAGSATTTDLTEGSNLYFTEARVRASLLTGLSSATGGTIVGSDSILTAFGRTENRLAALESTRLLKAGDTMTGPLQFSGATNYGVRLANFAASALPASPAVGALIFDTSGTYLRFWTGSTWKVVDATGGATGRWYDGSGTPSDATGEDGDYYIETQDNDSEGKIWKKAAGTWVGGNIVSAPLKARGGALTGAITCNSTSLLETIVWENGYAFGSDWNGGSPFIQFTSSGAEFIKISTAALDLNGTSCNLKMRGVQVLTAQQSAIADIAVSGTAEDGTARTKINAILAMLRTHGIIAT